MAGKWKNDRFGDIESGDTGRIREVVESIYDDGDLNDDFVSYVDNEGSLAYDFVENRGDLTSKYESMVEEFIDSKVDEFSEGDNVYIGGCDFEWVDEPTRDVVVMVKMTITDMQVNVQQFFKENVERTFDPESISIEVLKDEKTGGE